MLQITRLRLSSPDRWQAIAPAESGFAFAFLADGRIDTPLLL